MFLKYYKEYDLVAYKAPRHKLNVRTKMQIADDWMKLDESKCLLSTSSFTSFIEQKC